MLSNLVLNGIDLFDTNAYDVVTPVEGLDGPDRRMTVYDSPGEDGGVVAASYEGVRVITVPGLVKRGTAHEANRQALQAACAINRDVNGRPIPALLQITTKGGSNYFCYVHARPPKMALGNSVASPFLLTLTAPDPRLYGSSQQSSGTVNVPSGGGFILPVILPIVFGEGLGGSAPLTNSGNMTTWPILTLSGVLTNPYIYNATTGRLMQLNIVTTTTDVIIINMQNKTITLNGTSILADRTTDSQWWGLNPGFNNISFSTGSSLDTGTLTIAFYNAYEGI